jgi:hypothetical protein
MPLRSVSLPIKRAIYIIFVIGTYAVYLFYFSWYATLLVSQLKNLLHILNTYQLRENRLTLLQLQYLLLDSDKIRQKNFKTEFLLNFSE